jgi:acyl-CoA thioester hydrolase
VRYAETDAQGVAHHSSYVIWFELGRSEWLRARGYSYRDLEATGHIIVVADLGVRYMAPARYDDLLVLTTQLIEVRSRGLAFSYELHLADGPLLATGQTKHLVLDRLSGRPARLPAALEQALRQTN